MDAKARLDSQGNLAGDRTQKIDFGSFVHKLTGFQMGFVWWSKLTLLN